MSIGSNIKATRKRAGLTQSQLADMLGTSQQAVGKWESGKTVPGAESIAKIAEACGVPELIIRSGSSTAKYGELRLYDGDNKIIVYVAPVYGEVFYSLTPDELTTGGVAVYHQGVYAGAPEEYNRFLFNAVHDYLLDKGYMRIAGETVTGQRIYRMVD